MRAENGENFDSATQFHEESEVKVLASPPSSNNLVQPLSLKMETKELDPSKKLE